MIQFFSALSNSSPIPNNLIILDMGQSNSTGIAEAGRLPEQGYTTTPPGVKVYWKTANDSNDNGSWQAMECGVNTNQVYPSYNPALSIFNADLSVGQSLQELLDHDILIINGGGSGTSLAQNLNQFFDWNVDSIDEMLDRYLLYYFDVGVGKLTGSKKVLGIIWHQGEADAGDNTATANYETNLIAVIAKVRAHDPLLTNVPFFLTKLQFYDSGDGQNYTNQGLINVALQNIADSDDNVYLINIDDQPRKVDLTVDQKKGVIPTTSDDEHTSYLGQIAKGERVYDQIKTINNW